jgi:hypothetical protein
MKRATGRFVDPLEKGENQTHVAIEPSVSRLLAVTWTEFVPPRVTQMGCAKAWKNEEESALPELPHPSQKDGLSGHPPSSIQALLCSSSFVRQWHTLKHASLGLLILL